MNAFATRQFVAADATTAWQLQMFERTLKKRLRLAALRTLLEPLGTQQCLLVTCGDNNGAINWHLRRLGGRWSWADCEDRSIAEMSALLGDDVVHVRPEQLPYADGRFDVVVTIDVHEHVADPVQFMREAVRILKPGGRIVVTVPGGDPRKLANRLKHLIGMSRENYGHVRDGFGVVELQTLLRGAGAEPTRALTFSRLVTELIELVINYAYVKKLARKSAAPVNAGTIAPATSGQLQAVRGSYRLYSALYPLIRLVSQLDRLLFFTTGYVTMVEGTTGHQ